MKFDEKIIVMALKGTQPEDPKTPAAFAKCQVCKVDLVFDMRNLPRMIEENLKPYCGTCAADMVFADVGAPTFTTVTGLSAGELSSNGVVEFLYKIDARAKERVQ